MKESFKDIITQIVSLLLAFIILTITKGNEFIFAGSIIIILLINFKIKYQKGELKLFFIGLIIGFFIEVVLGLIYRMQYWQDSTLFGVPIWLPLVWGYAFVFIRRIGDSIIKNKISNRFIK